MHAVLDYIYIYIYIGEHYTEREREIHNIHNITIST